MNKIGNISDYFDEIILRRGYDYYNENKVKKVTSSNDNYCAIVQGTKKYRVRLKIEDDRIENMSCTCPYYSDVTNCKHIAAVLYYLKSGEHVEDNSADKLKENNKYVSTFNDKLITIQEESNYEWNNDTLEKLYKIVKANCKISKEKYKDEPKKIIELVCFIFEIIYNEYIENSQMSYDKYDDEYDEEYDGEYFEEDDYLEEDEEDDCEFDESFFECINMLEETFKVILKNDDVFDEALEYLKSLNHGDIEEIIVKIILESCKNTKRAQKLYNLLETKTKEKSNYYIELITTMLIIEKNYLKKELNLKEFLNKLILYDKSLNDLEIVINILFMGKEYDLVIEIIEELNLNKDVFYEDILFSSYYNSNKEKYYELLRQRIYRYKRLSDYKELREKYSYEECKYYYMIIEKNPKASLSDKIELYYFEKEYEKIFNILKDKDLRGFSKCIAYLPEEYNDKIMDKYKNEILKMYFKSYNVSNEMINYIWQLGKINNSEKIVNEIIETITKKGKITLKQRKELDFIQKTLY
ncbi:MAG: SWIM zinc finger domain-containing protein [Clostridia bacterium]